MDAKVMETFESWRANVTEEDLVKELGELAKPEADRPDRRRPSPPRDRHGR